MSVHRSSRRPSPADDAQLDFFALLADLDAAQNTALDPPAAPPAAGLQPAVASLDLNAPLTLDFDAEPAAAGLAPGGVPQRNTSHGAPAEHPTSETAAVPNTADDDRPLRAAQATAAPTAEMQDAVRQGLPPGRDYQPGGAALVPSGQVARARANLAALTTLRTLQDQARAAFPAEQDVLAGWSGWGALPGIFDADHLQAGDPYWPILAARVIPAAATAAANHGHHRVAEAAMELLTLPPEKPVEVARAAELLAANVRGDRDNTEPDNAENDSPAGADASERAAHALASALAQVAAAARLDPIRVELAGLLTGSEWAAAAASTLNAHYTDPVVVAAVWQVVQGLGFTGGPVLEPGCGSGNFIAAAPPGAVMTGVELDPTTAAIAAALYPSANIHAEGFEAPGWQAGSFTAVVGNVPFGGFKVYDPEFNPAGHTIHNHFLVKSLALTAPGGIVAAVTSAYTLDAASPAARRDMHALGDLLGAVRLPSGAFRAVAGTDVVTDLLIFRRRPDGDSPQPLAGWERAVDFLTDDGTIAVNRYFADHPEHILGTPGLGRGAHHRAELIIRPLPGQDLGELLADRLSTIVVRARTAGLSFTAPAGPLPPARVAPSTGWASDARPGTIRAALDGSGFQRLDPGTRAWTPYPVRTRAGAGSAAQTGREMRRLLELRDAAEHLIAVQAAGADPVTRHASRAVVNRLYDAYVTEFGPINRFTEQRRTGWVLVRNLDPDEIDPDWPTRQRSVNGVPQVDAAGDPVLQVHRVVTDQVRPPAVDALRLDPGFATVMALELFDEDTRTATKAPALIEDVLRVRARPTVAANPAEALALAMDADNGAIDLHHVAALLPAGTTPGRARDLLGGLVFPDPDHHGVLVPASRYLSGDVRGKLDTARTAAASDGAFTSNVTALAAVVPVDLGPGDIEIKPGVTWITPEDYTLFLREVLEAPTASAAWSDLVGRWDITVPPFEKFSHPIQHTYGTGKKDAVDLLESLLNNRPISITKTVADFDGTERQVPDPEATEAALDKRTKLGEGFASWVWADHDRAARLLDVYNRRFNSHVPPSFDGTHLHLPGLGEHFSPRRTQRDAVARVLAEDTLLDHVVGAGKSGTMFMAAMEMRRRGLARQPWIVVPNHLVGQVAREAKQWYPAARVLAGPSATTAISRREFTALTAVADFDLVIVPESLFTAIPVSARTRERYINDQLAALAAAKRDRSTANPANPGSSGSTASSGSGASGGGRSVTTKDIEAAKKRLEAKLIQVIAEGKAGSDLGVTFESSGCDYLFVDEAHYWKNKMVLSGTRDLARPDEPQRAMDLSMKLQVLREVRDDHRAATFATGTPIPNSPREMWVMLDYLRPDLLKAAGVEHFDAWAANHLRPETRLEMKITGAGFAPRTRITRFVNVPEMTRMWRQMADQVTRDSLDVQLPALPPGGRSTAAIPRSAEQAAYSAALESRADAVRSGAVKPDQDNILKISSDGRKAALDQRLVALPPDPAGGRLAAATRAIMRLHESTKDRVYTDEDGRPSPRTGGLQIVFCDQSTPKPGHWNVYTALRDDLTDAGMPADRIRFIHEASTDAQRADLFAAARDGRINVLIGSTHKMGTGANIQARAVGLHHLDVPWRPSDLEQREGRILRQGNQNTRYGPVQIHTYVTESTFDAFSWNLVTGKARFIAQVKNGGTARHVDADDADTLSFEQITALSAGDPRVLERHQLGVDAARLGRLQRAHTDEQHRVAFELQGVKARRDDTDHILSRVGGALAAITPTAGDTFTAIINHRAYLTRADAGRALAELVGEQTASTGQPRPVDEVIGRIGGLDLRLVAERGADKFTLTFPDVPDGRFTTLAVAAAVNAADAYGSGGTPGLGVIRRLEHHLNSLPNRVQDLRATHDGYPDKIARLTDVAGQDFPHHDELTRIQARISHLDTRLTDRTPAANAAPARRPEWLTRLDPDGTTLVWGPELQQVITDGRTTYDQLVVGDIITPPDKTAGPHRITGIHGYGTRDYHLQPVNGADRDNRRDVRISKKSNTGVTLIARPRSAFVPTPRRGEPGGPLVPARAGWETGGAPTIGRYDRRSAPPVEAESEETQAMSTKPRKLDAAGMSYPRRAERSEAEAITGLRAPTTLTAPPRESGEAARGHTRPGEGGNAGGVPGPVVQHGPSGTIVVGTSKDDTILRYALKSCGFKWSRNQDFWYLPRTMLEHTRSARISDLRSQLSIRGRSVLVAVEVDQTTMRTKSEPSDNLRLLPGESRTRTL